MRTTEDKKDFNLRIRLNDLMYKHLQEMSEMCETSFSGYVRRLIDKDIQEKNALKNFKKIKNPEIDPAKD